MNNPYLSMLATAWRYARQERKRYVLIYSMFVMANLMVAAHPLLYGWFVDSLQRDGASVRSFAWMYGLGYLGLRLVEWCFHGPARVMERKLAFNVSRNFLDEIYHQVLHLPMKWHQDHHTGSTINRIQKAYGALKSFFQNGFAYLHAFFKFVFSFAAMLYFAPLFGLIGVALGLFTVWVIFKFDKPYIKSLKEVNEKDHMVSATLFDSLSNILTVVTLRLEKRMETSFMSKVADVFPAFKRNITINEWKWFTAQMLIAIIYAVVVIGYVHQNYVPGETFFMGGLITLLGYVSQFTSVFNDIAAQYTQITQYNTDVQTARNIADAYAREHRPEAAGSLPVDWQSLSISHLNFTRPESNTGQKRFSGLRDLHVRIHRGQRIALVGESGCGKSTLLSLLRGLYVPQEDVCVLVDGDQPVGFESIAGTVTLLPQEPEIFENTLRYNITLGLPFSEEEVLEVCEVAQFTDVIRHLPHGLDTVIQEKGANFSGGQRQRLALARGILAARSSSIVLMDEPTSSVDPRTEVQLYNKLFKAFTGKAVVSSLHRLHLLSQFDYIYILQNGRVVEEGTFETLRYNSEVFREMWRHQQEEPLDKKSPGQAPDEVAGPLVQTIGL